MKAGPEHPLVPAPLVPAPLAPPPLPGAGDALFLDFDGTLVEIAAHPDAVRVAPGLPALIESLRIRLEGRLAIVSGRSLASLDRALGPIAVAMAGSHGGEFREAGARAAIALAEPVPTAVVARLHAVAAALGGLLVEQKPFSAAIHYRDRPEAESAVLAAARELARAEGLALKHGKMVAELIMPGSDKGSAVARYMALPGFAGARPLFAGDDTTDEDAFAAVARLAGGGILVGPMRHTAARWRLDGVRETHAWLAAALGEEPR
ncbi:trehalose-phosphatase [Novosphingobium album (ex Liu et al. 2023)]|uniref:Trehalose 6-phosphate phosphatase n=1 Tax=Novosphingobium album (ex Liu et al. 2023) TaxID=3031130 RepID=A0ABT5WK36_9SPHN|nr:trehalose-phosphatase [Novosphingobium album (ex Liu et al. 2023)]MDE8650279.1 trehalose-phosphatase [Novosphingobium album (ex Liu et al. 2023)]